MAETNDSIRWRQQLQFLMGVGLAVLFFLMLAPLIVPMLVGAVFAIVCAPLFDRLKIRMPRPLAALIVTLGLALGIMGPVIGMVYAVSYKLIQLVAGWKILKSGTSVDELAHHPFIHKFISFASRYVSIDPDWLHEQSLSLVQGILEKVSFFAGAALSGMPGLIMGFAVVHLSVFFFLQDGGKFLRYLARLSPLPFERSVELYSAFEKSCRGVVLGLFASALVQGILMMIVFWITGLGSVILIGFATILAGMIPLVGSAPIWVAAIVYLVSQASYGMAAVMLLGGILISTSDNIVRPLVMKGQSEMHPLLALVSVFGALNLVGPMGIFLGPIIAAVFVSFLKIMALETRKEP